MKTKKILLFIGGLLLVFGLSGCSSFRGTREDIEKRIAVLEEIYPTQNINDLNAKFPEGVEFSHSRHIENKIYSINLEIAGSKNAFGTYRVAKSIESSSEYQELLTVKVQVGENGKLVSDSPIEDEYQEYLENFNFLFQSLDLDVKRLKKLSLNHINSNANDNYYISYKLDNPLLSPSKFNGLEEEQLLSLSGNFAADKKGIFEKTIAISSGNNRISEWIQSKGTNNHE